jgi:hypothetical protein
MESFPAIDSSEIAVRVGKIDVKRTYRSMQTSQFTDERIVDGIIEINKQTISQTILSFSGIINQYIPDTDVAV